MNRALKGVAWTLGAYVGLQVGARVIRRRWPAPLPAALGWLHARPIGLRPPEILPALDLERGHHVLVMGAGLRPLTATVAERLGAMGRLVAVDPRPVALRRLAAAVPGLTNLTTQVADPRDLPCPASAFDRVVLASGLGGNPSAGRVAQEAFRVLKPHGRLVVVTEAWDVDYLFERRVLDLALAAGFVLTARRGGAWSHVLVFERPAAPNFLRAPHEEHRIETYG